MIITIVRKQAAIIQTTIVTMMMMMITIERKQNKWQLILIGDINITSSNSVVTGRMYKHDGNWCGGILIDYFVLVPVETGSGGEDLNQKSSTKSGNTKSDSKSGNNKSCTTQ